MTAAKRVTPLLFFALLTSGVYGVAIALSSSLPRLQHPGTLAAAVTVDLVVLVPVFWYLLVVRGLGWPWPTLVPVAAAGMVAASRIVPADHHLALRVLEFGAVPLELALLGTVAWRAATAMRRARAAAGGSGDPFSAIRLSVQEVVSSPRLADVVADELSVLYGGLVSWWCRPWVDRTDVFAFHRRDAHASLVAGLLLVLAIELFPVHLLLLRWSPVLAWVVTGLSLYGAAWMIADLQAMRLRPIRLTARTLDLRIGLRWDISIPFERIAGIERIRPGTWRAGRGVLNAVPLGEPTHRLTVRDPVVARGPYGLRRAVRAVVFGVDEPGRFEAALGRLGLPGPGVPPGPEADPGAGAGS